MVSKSILNGVKNAASILSKNSTSIGRAAKNNTLIREGVKGLSYTLGMITAFKVHELGSATVQKRTARKVYDNKSKLGQFFSSRP